MKHLIKQLSQKNISFNPLYRELTGSLAGGLYLSQLMYWFSKKDKIYKTDQEIMQETTLTKKELENAKKLIKKLPFITVSREGVPAKTYYEIDWEIFAVCIKKHNNSTTQNGETVPPKRGKQVSPNGGNSATQKGETYNVKSFDRDYTENTTDKRVRKKTPITPLEIITFYKENISSSHDKIKEQKSYNLLALKANELEEIFRGLKNYKDALAISLVDKKYVKSLKNFVEDKVYLDFQSEVRHKETNGWSNHGLDYDDSGEWK